MRNMLIFQSCDPHHYTHLLAVTQPTASLYALRHGCRYEAFIGLKRGVHPWHACFNRIIMLDEMIDRGESGWVLYLDTDSYIIDFGFDCAAYLADKATKAFVMAPGNHDPLPWEFNNGIFFANLGNPVCVELCRAWKSEFLRHWPDDLLANSGPSFGAPSDQALLIDVIRDGPQAYRDAIFLDQDQTFNYGNGRFARQVIRAHYATFEERVATAAAEIAAILPR